MCSKKTETWINKETLVKALVIDYEVWGSTNVLSVYKSEPEMTQFSNKKNNTATKLLLLRERSIYVKSRAI